MPAVIDVTRDNLASVEAYLLSLAAPEPLTFADLRIWTRDYPPRFATFDLNPVQERLNASLCRQYGCDPARPWELRGVRCNVLKGRQGGFSTYFLGLEYLAFYNLPYSQTVIITHHPKSTAMLWERVLLWEQEVRRTHPMLPELSRSNLRELVRKDTGSSLFIGTCGQDELVRSGTITTVHETETAYWDRANRQVSALLGTLPAWGNIWEESTASGIGPHQDRWKAEYAESRDTDGPSVYFFPFSDTSEYQQEPPSGFTRTPDEAEQTAERIIAGIRATEPLTDAQVYWRRLKAAEFGRKGEAPEKVLREFPATVRDAFQAASTDAYYPVEFLEALLEEAPDPVRVLEIGQNGFHGRIEVFEEPGGYSTVIGADESEGIDDGEHDNCAADGFREDTREQVFCYHGCPDGEAFAYDLQGLSGAYRDAVLVPERLLGGGTTINKLLDLWANVYKHERGNESVPERTKFGYPHWAKNGRDGALLACLNRADFVWRQNRREGMTARAACIEASCPVIRSKVTLNELLHYSNLEGNKRGGKGAHDDHNTSVSVATWYLENWPSGLTWEPEYRDEFRDPIMQKRRI